MPQEQLLGNIVLVVITLGSFIAVIQKFTQPINELKVVIQELRDCISTLRNDNEIQNKRIEKHGIEIDELKDRVGKVETKVNLYHKD
ncbi:hypothetical protein [Coprobacillus cateniformis]|uniref:hypothetical protein n=1 Tax=Coprobacillus cateniformis TaxID=100884 RepID=UPI0039A26777